MMQTTDALSKQQKNAAYMVQKLRENGYNTLNTVTSVIPIIVGDEYKLTQMSKDLLDRKHSIFRLDAHYSQTYLCAITK